MIHTTRRHALQTLLGLTTLMLVLNTGCGGGNSNVTPTIDPTVGSPKVVGNLQINLLTDKRSYAVGEPIQFTYTYKNVGTSTITLTFVQGEVVPVIFRTGTSIPVSPQGGAGVPDRIVLAPGGMTSIYYSWTNLYPDGVAIPAGVYTVSAHPESIKVDQLFYDSAQAQTQFTTNSVQFVIQ